MAAAVSVTGVPHQFRRAGSVLGQALLTGTADAPPPARRGLGFTLLAEVAITFALFLLTLNNTVPEGTPVPGALPLLATASCAPLLLRRHRPLAAWRLSLLGWLLLALFVPEHRPESAWGPALALVPILYTVAARCVPALALTVWLVTAAALPLIEGGGLLGFLIAATGAPMLLGYNVRERQSVQNRLEAEKRHSAAEQERRSVLEERARIARELHDVVAHHMSVIAIQAEAAPYLAEDLPEPITAAFADIRATALDALSETRRLLGVLRQETDDGDTAPQPGLDRLDALVAAVRGAGLNVEVTVDGTERPLPPGVGRNAYRIIQEALSNAMRHAPGAEVRVHLTHRPDALDIHVGNGPPPTLPNGRAPLPPGGGHGLVGMRERADALGGRLSAGPTGEGGYSVRATLPREDAA